MKILEQNAGAFFDRMGLNSRLAVLEHAWESEIGSLSRMAKVAAIDNAALVVEVESSTAMQELSLRRRELLRRLNRHFAHPFLKDISLRIASHGVPRGG